MTVDGEEPMFREKQYCISKHGLEEKARRIGSPFANVSGCPKGLRTV